MTLNIYGSKEVFKIYEFPFDSFWFDGSKYITWKLHRATIINSEAERIQKE